MVYCLRLYKLFRHGNQKVLAYRWRTKNCFPNGLQKFDERTRQLMSTRGYVVTTLRPIALNNPGFLACQLKTRVYSHKVLPCSRENTEETSSRAKIGREKTATFQRKQPVRWYCRMWDWQHGARDRGVWRRTVEKKNQRIGAIPGERNCPKQSSWSCLRKQEILCEKHELIADGCGITTVNTKFSPFSCNVFSTVWIDEVFI